MAVTSSLLRFSPSSSSSSSKTLIPSLKPTHYSSTSSFAPLLPSSTGGLIPNLRLTQRRPITTVVARISGNNNNYTGTTPATDRLISALAYTLPFFNSLQYGRFLFAQFPSISALVLEPILPLLSVYRSLPYASFVAFFGIYLGIVRNNYFSDYARFNAMQALTLDVLLVLPLLLGRIFSPGRSGLGLKLMVWGHNGVFFFTCLCFAYGLVSSVLGKTPYLPFVADAARRQM
ncbi:Protein TIC 20-II, chloroplastic [Linum grandiflorum]